jgi:hypothetical protein
MRLMVSGSLAVLALLAIAAFTHCHSGARAQSESDPISGKWDVTFLVNGHTTPATFDLKLDGTKVTGTANSDHTGLGTVRDGTWDKGKLSFTLDFQKHESIAITGAIKEAKLVGEFRTEGFVANWEAVKKP